MLREMNVGFGVAEVASHLSAEYHGARVGLPATLPACGKPRADYYAN